MKLFIQLWDWLFGIRCPKCGNKSVYFSHEMHFWPGSPNVYKCRECKNEFV